MTPVQQLLNKLGAWRFKRFRRWVGGRWAQRTEGDDGGIETPLLLGYDVSTPLYRWDQRSDASFTDKDVCAIEQWPLPWPMTFMQRRLYARGFGQRRWFRRWVGGRWVQLAVYMRGKVVRDNLWLLDNIRQFERMTATTLNLNVVNEETWGDFPTARAVRAAYAPDDTWRGCNCGRTPETGPDPSCDREPLGVHYGCRSARGET